MACLAGEQGVVGVGAVPADIRCRVGLTHQLDEAGRPIAQGGQRDVSAPLITNPARAGPGRGIGRRRAVIRRLSGITIEPAAAKGRPAG